MIGQNLKDMVIETRYGPYKLSNFIGYTMIVSYSESNGVDLTELAWLNVHYDGFKQMGVNIIVTCDYSDEKILENNIMITTNDRFKYPVQFNCNLFKVKGHSVCFLDREYNVEAFIEYLNNVGFNMVEMFRLFEALRLKKIGLNTPCNWMGLREFNWEDREIFDGSILLSEAEKRFKKIDTLLTGLVLVEREQVGE